MSYEYKSFSQQSAGRHVSLIRADAMNVKDRHKQLASIPLPLLEVFPFSDVSDIHFISLGLPYLQDDGLRHLSYLHSSEISSSLSPCVNPAT